MTQIYDVVIVGGGPAGTGLAIDLGQRSIKVALIERYHQPQQVPKGQNLTQRTMEHFQAWNCEGELRKRRLMPPGVANGGMNCFETILSQHRYDWLPREKVSQYYNAAVERLPQYETEATLRQRVQELDTVETFYGWSAVDLLQTSANVSLTIQEHRTPEHRSEKKQEIQAFYIVGCDGSNSVVRDQANIPQTRDDHDKLMVLLVFESTELHDLLSIYPERSFYNALHPKHKGYWQFLGRVDVGKTWFFHAPVPAGTNKDNFDFAGLLHSAVGQNFSLNITYVGFWDLRIANADTYAKDRVMVAGDAAHSHPPYGGFGINLGLEDARNLGWKLAALVKGWGGDKLLNSFDVERRNVFQSTAKDFIGNFIEEDRAFLENFHPEKDMAAFEAEWHTRQASGSEVTAFEPNYEGSPIIYPDSGKTRKPSAKGAHTFKAQAGHHLSPVKIDGTTSVYTFLGEDFTLLDFSTTGQTAVQFQKAAQELGVPLKAIHKPNDLAKDQLDAEVILVRPDNFVSWVGNGTLVDAVQVLSTASGR